MPLSQEIRTKIVFHKTNGETNVDIARWLVINEKSVRRIWALYNKQNSVEPLPHNKGRKPAFGQDVTDKIIAKIKEQPDITLEELIEEFDLKISISALCRKLKKLNLNFKKKTLFAKEQQREDVQELRRESRKSIFRRSEILLYIWGKMWYNRKRNKKKENGYKQKDCGFFRRCGNDEDS